MEFWTFAILLLFHLCHWNYFMNLMGSSFSPMYLCWFYIPQKAFHKSIDVKVPTAYMSICVFFQFTKRILFITFWTFYWNVFLALYFDYSPLPSLPMHFPFPASEMNALYFSLCGENKRAYETTNKQNHKDYTNNLKQLKIMVHCTIKRSY